MNKEERYLINKVGKKEPFKVPDGYFNDFADQLLANLPERNSSQIVNLHSTRWNKFRTLSIAAASIVAVVFSASLYLYNNTDKMPVEVAHAKHIQATSSTANFDEMANYAMIDNEELYAALTYE